MLRLSLSTRSGGAVRAGERIAGRYQLVERLGRGGMGEVWRGLDLELGRAVALKVLRELDAGDEMLARFRREAAIGAQFQHPGITVVHDIGQHENQLFIVMELLDGEDLARVLARTPDGLPVAKAVDLAAQAARALAVTHAQGVVHRDLKPANLFLLADGRLKICDFGIARGVQATRATRTGWMLGSPPYMAPEQWRGKDIGTSADLYALGCVMYELLTGAPPFPPEPEPLALMHRHFEETPAPLRSVRADVPEELGILVAALLSKHPDTRPDATSTADRLQGVETRSARQQPQPQPRPRPEAPAPAAVAPAAVPTETAFPTLRDPSSPEAPTRSSKLRRRAILFAGTVALFSAPALSALTDGSDSTPGDPTTDPQMRTGTLSYILNQPDFIGALAFSPDGSTLASGGARVRLWNLAARSTTATFDSQPIDMASVVFSPDGKTLAGGGFAYPATVSHIKLWNVATGATIATLTGDTQTDSVDQVLCLAFSPDGKTLAGAYLDGTARLWDVATGTITRTLAGEAGGVGSVAFSPDGKTLAGGSGAKDVQLWDPATGATVATLTGHTEPVMTVAFSPDGKTLASAGNDHTIRLWDLGTRKALATLTGHINSVFSVAFSPDSRTLASGSADHTVRLWDAVTGAATATLTGHTSYVRSVAFSPDGKILASGGDDLTIRVWKLSA